MLDRSTAIEAFQELYTCPRQSHVGPQVASDIFQNHFRYKTLLFSVPLGLTMVTTSIVIQRALLKNALKIHLELSFHMFSI